MNRAFVLFCLMLGLVVFTSTFEMTKLNFSTTDDDDGDVTEWRMDDGMNVRTDTRSEDKRGDKLDSVMTAMEHLLRRFEEFEIATAERFARFKPGNVTNNM